MRWPLLSVLATTAALTTGCVTDDPRQGGFVGGVVGIMSGKYDERVATRRAALEDESARNLAAKWEGDSLDAGRHSRSVELASIRGSISAMNNKLKNLERTIRDLRARNLADDASATDIEKEIAATKRRTSEVIASIDRGMDEATARARKEELMGKIEFYEEMIRSLPPPRRR
ncbi:MAG TPA: hypothetical protein VGE72_19265 [Azospirillum sp.]